MGRVEGPHRQLRAQWHAPQLGVLGFDMTVQAGWALHVTKACRCGCTTVRSVCKLIQAWAEPVHLWTSVSAAAQQCDAGDPLGLYEGTTPHRPEAGAAGERLAKTAQCTVTSCPRGIASQQVSRTCVTPVRVRAWQHMDMGRPPSASRAQKLVRGQVYDAGHVAMVRSVHDGHMSGFRLGCPGDAQGQIVAL